MAVIVHTDTGTYTASAGTFSKTIIANNNILSHIFIKATTSSTTFDMTLTDIYGNVTVTREDIAGELNETGVDLPTYGNYTLTVYNASVDEDFKLMLAFEETR